MCFFTTEQHERIVEQEQRRFFKALNQLIFRDNGRIAALSSSEGHFTEQIDDILFAVRQYALQDQKQQSSDLENALVNIRSEVISSIISHGLIIFRAALKIFLASIISPMNFQ